MGTSLVGEGFCLSYFVTLGKFSPTPWKPLIPPKMGIIIILGLLLQGYDWNEYVCHLNHRCKYYYCLSFLTWKMRMRVVFYHSVKNRHCLLLTLSQVGFKLPWKGLDTGLPWNTKAPHKRQFQWLCKWVRCQSLKYVSATDRDKANSLEEPTIRWVISSCNVQKRSNKLRSQDALVIMNLRVWPWANRGSRRLHCPLGRRQS